jgi:hypothetical protein
MTKNRRKNGCFVAGIVSSADAVVAAAGRLRRAKRSHFGSIDQRIPSKSKQGKGPCHGRTATYYLMMTSRTKEIKEEVTK